MADKVEMCINSIRKDQNGPRLARHVRRTPFFLLLVPSVSHLPWLGYSVFSINMASTMRLSTAVLIVLALAGPALAAVSIYFFYFICLSRLAVVAIVPPVDS